LVHKSEDKKNSTPQNKPPDSEKHFPPGLSRKLLKMGLTNNQTLVYRAIYLLKECTLFQIAHHLNVTAAKVSPVINQLKMMNSVTVIPKSQPEKFSM